MFLSQCYKYVDDISAYPESILDCQLCLNSLVQTGAVLHGNQLPLKEPGQVEHQGSNTHSSTLKENREKRLVSQHDTVIGVGGVAYVLCRGCGVHVCTM